MPIRRRPYVPARQRRPMIGVIHTQEKATTEEQLRAKIEANSTLKEAYDKVMSEIGRLRKGATIMIETPGLINGKHHFFSFIASRAREMGHTITPAFDFSPATNRRLSVYKTVIEGMRRGKPLYEVTLDADFPGVDMPESLEEAVRKYLNIVGIRTNRLIRNALSSKPDMIIAGSRHIEEAEPWIGKRYRNLTPIEIRRRIQTTIQYIGPSQFPDLYRRFEKQRSGIVERASRRRRTRLPHR